MEQLNALKARVTGAAENASMPKIGKPDIIAGVTTGIANVPDGMASGVLAGINPIYGIYTLIVGTPVAALTASTQLMMFNTTSAMTLVAVDGLGSSSGDERVQRMIIVALIAGVFQLVLGLLGLGMLTKFVSNSVMVGFLTGIAALIIMGQLWDLTGFEGDSGTKLQNTALLLKNLGDVDPSTTFIGVGALVLMFVFAKVPQVSNFNLLVALGIAILAQVIFKFDSVATVGEVPRSLPNFQLPEFKYLGTMLIAGVATGTVGLLQAAGVAQAFPNPDGSETSDSRDFSAQGLANIVTSSFQGMAGGGSLSGTALNVGAGAVTRFANVVQAFVVIIFILVFSGLLSKIPSAALAALLIYASYISIKWAAIASISRSSWTSIAGMLLTFLATLVVPLQQAVMFGVVVAGVLFIYRASIDVTVKKLSVDDGHFKLEDPPETLESDAVTVLDVDGNLFYAGARTMVDRLPDASTAENAVVVMRVRGQSELGTTFFKVINKYAAQIKANGGKFLLAGVDASIKQKMQKSGALSEIGPENVFESNSILGESTLAAAKYGEDLRAGLPAVTGEANTEVVDMSPVPRDDEGTTAADLESPSDALHDDIAAQATALKNVTRFIDAYVPWRETAAWKAVALLGGVLTLIGALLIFVPDLLDSVFRGLTGSIFIGVSLFWIYQILSTNRVLANHVSELRMLSAGMAFMAGASLVMAEATSFVSTDSARLLSGFAMISIGIVGIASIYYRKLQDLDRKFGLAINSIIIVVGVISLVQLQNGRMLFNDLRWLMLVLGLALLLYAYLLMRYNRPEKLSDLLPLVAATFSEKSATVQEDEIDDATQEPKEVSAGEEP